MIAALIQLIIVVVVVGVLLWLLLYCVETFICPVPQPVRAAIGIIALLVVCLYLLRVFGIA